MEWWEGAWRGRDDITVEYEIQVGKDKVTPGTPIKFKNTRGTFKFRCRATHESGAQWIDCMESRGAWRSFGADTIKCVVKPRQRRRRKSTT